MVGVSTLVPSCRARRPLAERPEPRRREGRVAAVVAPGLEVVGDPRALQADLLGVHRVVEEAARPELLGAGLVGEVQGHGVPGRARRGRDGRGGRGRARAAAARARARRPSACRRPARGRAGRRGRPPAPRPAHARGGAPRCRGRRSSARGRRAAAGRGRWSRRRAPARPRRRAPGSRRRAPPRRRPSPAAGRPRRWRRRPARASSAAIACARPSFQGSPPSSSSGGAEARGARLRGHDEDAIDALRRPGGGDHARGHGERERLAGRGVVAVREPGLGPDQSLDRDEHIDRHGERQSRR